MRSQAVASIPSDYKGLRAIMQECKDQREFNERLMKAFDSEDVRNRLGSIMDLTIKILEWISRYYQQQRHSKWRLLHYTHGGKYLIRIPSWGHQRGDQLDGAAQDTPRASQSRNARRDEASAKGRRHEANERE